MTKTILAFLLIASASFGQTTTLPDPIPLGSNVSFLATSDGTPAPTFEWFKDGVKVGAGATYAIPAIALANAGSYTVKATNSLGSATSAPYIVRVGAAPTPPVITVTATRPGGVSITVPQGTTVNVQKK